ncbi:MAG: outer membrane beta-barrel protein [Calditrichaeota bacterium]|nr:outer membrane beta-barrel protein [Calditrichota bacterium]
MKPILFAVIFIIVISFFVLDGSLSAEELPRTGIGVRFSHWNVKDKAIVLYVHDNYFSTEVDAGGYGGAIFFFSRINHQFFVEFTVGAIGAVDQRTRYWDYEEVQTNAVIPLLFGLRYNLLPISIQSNLQPYAQAGFGTYWISDIHVESDYFYDSYEKVSFSSESRPGGYVGAGMNFMLSKKFAINFDMRYHMVDFRSDEYHNGIEFGFGCSLMWGK